MDFLEFASSFTLLCLGMPLIGFMLGIFYYKSLDVVHKGITWYLFAMVLVDISSRILGATGNNIIGLLFYSLLEVSMFTFFYFRYFFKVKHRLVLFLFFAACIYILYEILIFDKENMAEYQSYAKVVDDFIIIILALTFFHEKINIFKESKWDNFRLNAVVVVFFSVNLVFFLPFNFIINKSSGYQLYFWFAIAVTILMFYSYLTYAVWKNGRTRKLLLSGLQ
ncbi:MAG: hypothetical protein DI539_11040 [Flavobacterium psychrophilum]|nr:MAG: hypothetical protein DI539_11040 [Flavobacterium psychrophilum]